MRHVKNQVQMANRTHLQARLPGVAAPKAGSEECPAQLSSHCLLSAATLGCRHRPAVLWPWKLAGLLPRWSWLAIPPGFLAPFHHRFTPALPSDSGHPGLRWPSSVTRLISLPLPCFTSVSHPVSPLPHSARVCGDHLRRLWNRGPGHLPLSCTRQWDKLPTRERGSSQLRGVCRSCGLQFTFRSLGLMKLGPTRRLGKWTTPSPMTEASAATASITGASGANSLSGFNISFWTTC